MKSDILSHTDLLFLPEISIVLFTGVFLFALFWAFRPGSRAIYEARGRMPLDDGDASPSIDPNQGVD